jgi:hypothetical protein
MADGGTTCGTLAATLDRRAAALACLLDSHPARHLLAEYEAVFLDRQPCVERAADHDDALSASDLLARMEAAIDVLLRDAARPPGSPLDRRLSLCQTEPAAKLEREEA